MTAELNQDWATTVVSALARSGVRTVVVAPGSRSTALVLAAHEHAGVRTVVHLDERSAAFFALGVAKATARPAAVLTTSGTAVANLLPAVVEADASETPLVLLTADRPARLRGADANQTIPQVGIFGDRVRAAIDLPEPRAGEDARRHLAHVVARSAALARGPAPGAVHINAPFSKPLEPESSGGRRDPGPVSPTISDPQLTLGHADLQRFIAELRAAEKGLIVAGPARSGAHRTALELARATGFPVLADPLSGARYPGQPPTDVTVVGVYDVALRATPLHDLLQPDLVVQIGASPTSTTLLEFLDRSDASRYVVDPGGRWKDHPARARGYLRADVGWLARQLQSLAPRLERNPTWNVLWNELQQRTAHLVQEALAMEPQCEGTLLWAALNALDQPCAVFVSNSMPIRDMDAFVVRHSMPLQVMGNRGASGIDGVVSTALGAAWAQSSPEEGATPSLAVLGDLALLHDGNGLLAAREGMDLVILVINNDGGGIFHMLPIQGFEPEFTRYFATPHGRDFRHLAALYDIPWACVPSSDLARSVRDAVRDGGVRILEVRSQRAENHASRSRILNTIVERLSQRPVNTPPGAPIREVG